MIARDKLLHAAFGFAVALATIGLLWVAERFSGPVAMLAAGLTVGVGYELVQRLRSEGVPDVRDALATGAGAAVAAFLAYLLPALLP